MHSVCRSMGTAVGVGEHINAFGEKIQLKELLQIRKTTTSVFLCSAGLDKPIAKITSSHLLASPERYHSLPHLSFSVVPQTQMTSVLYDCNPLYLELKL